MGKPVDWRLEKLRWVRHKQKDKRGREKQRWSEETESQWQCQFLTFSLHLVSKFNFLLVPTSVNVVISGMTLGKYLNFLCLIFLIHKMGDIIVINL